MTNEKRFAGAIRRCRHSVAWAGTAAGLFFASTPAAAQTCPCPTFDLSAIVKEADMIFVGKSLSATNDSTGAMKNDSGGWTGGVEFQTRLLFDVETVIKGELPRFVEVVTPTGSCGFAFTVGETYLVVGKGQGGAVSTDSCKGNVSGSAAIDSRAAAIRKVLYPDPMPARTRERR